MYNPSGQPIDKSVRNWVEENNNFIADITKPNDNVTFEIGYSLGLGKPTRLIRAANSDLKNLEEIGLLHNIAHDTYEGQDSLEKS